MGNICSQLHQDESCHKQVSKSNSTVGEFGINKTRVQLIHGSYRYHQADLLLVFAQLEDFEYCSEIKDYALNYLELIETATSSSKSVIHVHTNRSCPYKLFSVAILPAYNSQQAEQYYKEFQQTIGLVLQSTSQLALQICTTSETGKGVPNQTLISLFIKYLLTYQHSSKIYLISKELRLLNMVRYQMAKLGTFVPVAKSESHDGDQ